MSRQFSFYLLPPDVAQLLDLLRSRSDLNLIQATSPNSSVVEIESPYSDASGHACARIHCYITAKHANVFMRYLSSRSVWHVEDRSEVIQFSGCEFDGELLLKGRFYFQTDFLADGMIVLKKKEFLDWANLVFRVAKSSLRYSKSLNAYVGEHADKWKAQGGRFAWMVTPQRGPLYAEE